jgi:pseudaminic acid cytidylyltransferase
VKLAIIPARGGSKRIPRKNIRKFAGKPIISYSIEAAKESQLFDRIVVSTDDSEIAQISNEWGAETPFIRPKELADDYVNTNMVIKHAIQWYQNHGEDVQYACCIYATAPFLQPSYLREGFIGLSNSMKSFAFSVTSFPFPIQRAILISKEGTVNPLYPEYIFTRSQDLDLAYHDAGQFCWGSSEAFLNNSVIFSPASLPVILPRYMVQDIDTLEDWRRAELLYKALQMSLSE